MPQPARQISLPFLFLTYISLLALLALTLTATHLPLGHAGLLIALAIATAKALLILLYFMNLRFSTRLTRLFAAAGFLWLTILFTLTFTDYLTRSWLPRAQNITPTTNFQPSPSSH